MFLYLNLKWELYNIKINAKIHANNLKFLIFFFPMITLTDNENCGMIIETPRE